MSAAPTILVVRFGALGDVILTTPLVRAIATAHPAAAITFVTKAAYAPVLSRNPHLRQVVTLPSGGGVSHIAAQLSSTPWDYRMDLHGNLRSRALRLLTGGRWSTYRKGRGQRLLMVGLKLGRHREAVPVADRYFEAARPLDVLPDGKPAEVFTSTADEQRARAIAHGSYVVLAPGAAHATKRWPGTHWQRLASQLNSAGQRIVGVGLTHERPQLGDAPVVDAFGVGLAVTAALLRGARVVVANDSGLMHLATAVGAPVIALFGPTVGALGFSPYRARAVVLGRDLGCRPCSVYGSRRCPLGHHRCMIEIDPEEVHVAVMAA